MRYYQKWIDWNVISYYAEIRKGNSTFIEMMKTDILEQDEEHYENKLDAIRSNKAMFDWTTGVPFDIYLYMYKFQVSLRPETKATKSPYSALILP